MLSLLDKLNKERKAIETQMLEEALAEADRMVSETPDLPIVLVGSHAGTRAWWASSPSRLTERFHRPSCVIAWESEKPGASGTGSLRSVAGVDIGGRCGLPSTAGHLDKGGGHAMAAGLTVPRAQIEPLRAFLADRLKNSVPARRARQPGSISMAP